MKVRVDGDLCIACGLCVDVCPDVFELKDDKARVKVETVPVNSEQCAKEAVSDCPVDAITVA
jgi:ferredoxin